MHIANNSRTKRLKSDNEKKIYKKNYTHKKISYKKRFCFLD